MRKSVDVFTPDSTKNYYIDYIWTDKKRYFGMAISFTKYALSKDRLFEDRGLLITRHNEILLYRVKDISVSISLWQRLFGVGTIRVYSHDSSSPILHAINVKEPLGVKELIHCYVEKVKDEKGFYIGEYMSGSN